MRSNRVRGEKLPYLKGASPAPAPGVAPGLPSPARGEGKTKLLPSDRGRRSFLKHTAFGTVLLATNDLTSIVPDDIKRLVVPVFAHRLTVSSRYSSAMRRSEEAETVLHEILKTISVPL